MAAALVTSRRRVEHALAIRAEAPRPCGEDRRPHLSSRRVVPETILHVDASNNSRRLPRAITDNELSFNFEDPAPMGIISFAKPPQAQVRLSPTINAQHHPP
jgi:hypothetical protein